MLGDEKTQQKEYTLQKRDALLKHLLRQEKEYLQKYGYLFKEFSPARQTRATITVSIKGKSVELTQTEALCLLAYKNAVSKYKHSPTYPHTITGLIWKGESLDSKDKFKFHWANLKSKLKNKEFELPSFVLENRYDGHCIKTHPKWLKHVKFPKSFNLPLSVRANR